ncbi:N-acetyltransferase family protein [Propionibacteriaceae bacterium G1746]|uniref:GNAT family N-acetyltransferase n=1 Tax=Aestuariimicrobium sp. G57 TaxID=3418485 RepID=UPI003C268830
MKPLSGRFRIKQASTDELLPAARMMAKAWRQSFPFNAEVFARQDQLVGAQAKRWDDANRRGGYFWVVIDSEAAGEDDRIVGLAHSRVSDDTDAPTPLELHLLYLLDVAKGSGIADRLVEMAIGDAPAHLWVLEGNERAIAFYERHGFVADGGRRQLPDDLGARVNIRMVRQ